MKWLIALCLMLFAAPTFADEARPLYVEAAVQEQGAISLAWRIPPNFAPAMAPEIRLPEDCEMLGPLREWSGAIGHWRAGRWQCAQSMAGRTFTIEYPSANPNLATIFRVVQPGGSSTVSMTLPGETTHVFPAAAGDADDSGMWDYLVLGVEHIWLGFDHLLFVACLVWIAGTPGRILATVTGFTLAHSVTLAMAALNMVWVPIQAVEVIIALSIVLLAVELARGRRDTLTWRYPVAVSSGFGLLHGFGFAAVLREIGLPQDGLVEALFAFNVGIEAGQLLFVLALAGTSWVLVRLWRAAAKALPAAQSVQLAPPAGPQVLVAYAVGITATYWMLERAL